MHSKKPETFEELFDFYYNDKVEWAKRKSKLFAQKQFWLSVLASLVAGVFLGQPFLDLCKKLFNEVT